MDTIEKLHEIEKHKCIYNIHYCKAGIGIVFYSATAETIDDFKKGLHVEKYYPTFEDCINAEYNKLTNSE